MAFLKRALLLCWFATIFASIPLTAGAVPILLVGAANGAAVQQYDGTTGAAIGDFTSGGLGDGGYSALAFGPNGDLFVKYWAFGGRVDRFDGSTGAFVSTFVPTNGGTGGAAIVFSPNGQFFYHGDLGGNVDRHSASTGALVGDDFVPAGSGGLAAIGGVRFGPGSDLYVRNTFNFGADSNVLRFDGATGAFEGQFVTTGSGGLGGNGDIVFGPDGNLYVADLSNDVVRRYDGTNGASLGTFASGGGLDGPYGLAFGPGGDLFVAGHLSNAVFRYDGSTGAFESVFAVGTNTNPSYIAFVPEPGPLTLLGIGAAVSAWWRWKRRP